MDTNSSMDAPLETPHNGSGVEVAAGDDTPVEAAEERDRDASLALRLWRAAADIGRLEKDAVHEIRKDGKKVGSFNYITHDQVAAQVKRAFLKHGIMVLPTVTECRQDGNRTVMHVRVAVINVDNPEDKIETDSVGYGVDSSDKGPGKAYSYAVKYAYMKLLMLNSADDIEAAAHDYEPAIAPEVAAKERFNGQRTLQAWANSFKAALTTASSVSEVNDLQKENKDTLMSIDVPSVTRDFFIELIEQRKKELAE